MPDVSVPSQLSNLEYMLYDASYYFLKAGRIFYVCDVQCTAIWF